MELKALKMMDICRKSLGHLSDHRRKPMFTRITFKRSLTDWEFRNDAFWLVVNCLMFDWLDVKQIWEFLSVRADQWLWYVCEMALYRIKYEIYFAYVGYITMVWYTTKAASAFEVFCRWILWFTIVMILICIWKTLIGDIG